VIVATALSPANCARESICLRRRATAGARIERTRRPPPQCFRQKLLVWVGHSVGADVRRGLGSFVRSLVVVESSLHVDAVNRIVDAVLNVSEVAHEILPERLPICMLANAIWRTVFHGIREKLR
jgi:hypothetical protein